MQQYTEFLPGLVDLEQDEDGDGVHEGRVELEVGVVWADVVTCAHDPLHDEGEAHGVVHAKVLRDAVEAVKGRVGPAQDSLVKFIGLWTGFVSDFIHNLNANLNKLILYSAQILFQISST